MPSLRQITGKILYSDGTAWPGAEVQFTPTADTFTVDPDETFPLFPVKATAGSQGDLLVHLVAGTGVPYRVTLPDRFDFFILVPEGAATTLELLRMAWVGNATIPATSVETAILEVLNGMDIVTAIQHQALSGAGTNTHAVIDAFIAATGNAVAAVLQNKTLDTPTITDLSLMQHNHDDADSGGKIPGTAIGSGQVPPAQLGTGTPTSSLFLRGDGSWATPPGDPNAVPVGVIQIWPILAAPSGWLICDGQTVLRSSALGVKLVADGMRFGTGDGSTTVAIPNLKGKFIVGYNAAETEFDLFAEQGGEKAHTLTWDESGVRDHTHLSLYHAHGEVSKSTGGGSAATIASNSYAGTTGSGNFNAITPHNNLPPYMGLNWIIKA